MIPILKPDLPPLEELVPFFSRALEAGVFSNFGPLVSGFEARIAHDFFDACPQEVACITASSGTAAIEIAIQAMGLPKNSRIAVLAFGFVAAACAVARLGHQPVFMEVDDQNWEMTPESMGERLSRTGAAAAIVVSPFGYPVDAGKWSRFSQSAGIPVLVDMAAGLGNQRNCGTLPFVFSLHATKAFGIGEGGLVVMADHELAARLRVLTNFGLENRIARSVGGNAKMSEWHGAIALAQLSRWGGIVARRRQVREYYRQVFSGLPVRFHPQAWSSPVPPYMPVRLPTPQAGIALIEGLASSGIEARRWFYPAIPSHPAYRDAASFPDLTAAFPVADDLAATVVCLPFYSGLPAEIIEKIANLTCRVIENHGCADPNTGN